MSVRRKRFSRLGPVVHFSSPERAAAYLELLDHLGEDLAREHVCLLKASDPSDGDPSDSRNLED